MAKPGATGLRRIMDAFGYSMKGFRAALVHESAFRQELALCLVMVPAAFWLGGSPLEQALLLATLFVVLIVELLNSAVEAVVDRVGDEHDELAGRAKDMGSAAVFLSLTLVGVTWGLLLYQRFV
ncbi:MAG: diacylglycerol kinase [Gammaproteobacteria bacterium SG8_47]|nr:MAG: diacylglycerol kinase [Gammaproteobacteria bacterium SG8_47]